jgi:hypothetical protein
MTSLEEFQRVNTRPASMITIGGFRPTGNPLASHFGLEPVARPGEGWPHVGDRPLFFICQLNLSEPPFVPDHLRDIALVTVFISRDSRRLTGVNRDVIVPAGQSGDEWLVRTYDRLDGLLPLTIPAGASFYRGFEVRYSLVEDHPVFDDPEIKIPKGFDDTDIHLDNIPRSKVGGYASNIQSEPSWCHVCSRDGKVSPHPSRPRFCFQIATEEKVRLYLGDNGMLYFARGTAPGHESRWFLDSQCY